MEKSQSLIKKKKKKKQEDVTEFYEFGTRKPNFAISVFVFLFSFVHTSGFNVTKLFEVQLLKKVILFHDDHVLFISNNQLKGLGYYI